MKKFFLLFTMLVCVLVGRAQAPIDESLLPTVMGFKFGTSSFDVEYSLGKKYQISKDDKGIVVPSPLVFGRKFSVGVFEFDANKLSQCQFIHYAKDVEDADRFYQDMKGVLGRKYGEGVAEEKKTEETVKALCFGKHCQGGPYSCGLYLFRSDGEYVISLYYMPVRFSDPSEMLRLRKNGPLPAALGVVMGDDKEEALKKLLEYYGAGRVKVTDSGDIEVLNPSFLGVDYEAAFFSSDKETGVINTVLMFKSTNNPTTAKIYYEQVNAAQVEYFGPGVELPCPRKGIIQRIGYGRHYNEDKHSHFVELFYDDVAGYMITVEYEKIKF